MTTGIATDLLAETSFLLWDQLEEVLTRLPDAVYAQPIPALYRASIGQHTRHIIEFFQCIPQQHASGVVCYDARKRDLALETSTLSALEALTALREWLLREEQDWEQSVCLRMHPFVHSPEAAQECPSNLQREWWFAVDHAIHHLALVKVGLHLIQPDFPLPAHFGVAPATVHYQQR